MHEDDYLSPEHAYAEVKAERDAWKRRALELEQDLERSQRDAEMHEQTVLELLSDAEKANQTPPMFQPDGFDPLRPSTLRRARGVNESEEDHSLREYM